MVVVHSGEEVVPFVQLADLNKNDVLDLPIRGVAALARAGHQVLAMTQTGRLRWYAASGALGTALALLFVVVAF